MSSAYAKSRWGATKTPDPRKPRHLVDQERSATLGEAISLCGEYLYYVEADTRVRAGDPCSGRRVVAERTRECIRCLRREVEREVTVVTLPVEAVAQLASGAPSHWASISRGLDPAVVSCVNSQI